MNQRLEELKSTLPYIVVPVQQIDRCANASETVHSPSSVWISINVDNLEMPSKSPKKRNKRSESPMAQYALFPMPPSRPPLSASPLTPQFPSSPPPSGSQPVPSPYVAVPNSTQSYLGGANRSFASIRESQHRLDGLDVSDMLNSYSFGSLTPTAMPRAVADSGPWIDEREDTWSIASSTDMSIYAISTSSSSSLSLHEGADHEEPVVRGSSFLWNSRSSAKTLYYSVETDGHRSGRRQRMFSKQSAASSTDSLLAFDELVHAAKKGEAETAAREAELEEAEALMLADEMQAGDADWEALQQEKQQGQGLHDEKYLDSGHACWQDSIRSMASLHSIRSQLSRPDMRSRQSSATTIRAAVRSVSWQTAPA